MLYPINCFDARMDPNVFNKEDHGHDLRGTFEYLEVWDYFPTLCFMTMDGCCYHDISLQQAKVELYHNIIKGPNGLVWDAAADHSAGNERPIVFDPPSNIGNVFDKERNWIAQTNIFKGFVWERSNILLYFCRDDDCTFRMWPVHKLTFGSMAATKLPNWRKKQCSIY